MPDWLLDRKLIIGLAIVGGIFSLLATWSKSRNQDTAQMDTWFSRLSYGFMGVSIVLFIAAGMFGSDG